jgi:hypothetical protein
LPVRAGGENNTARKHGGFFSLRSRHDVKPS